MRIPWLFAIPLACILFLGPATGCAGAPSQRGAPPDRPPSVASQTGPADGSELGAGPLTIEQALALAEARNPSLAALEREVAAARGRELQAGLKPNPSVFIETEDGPLYRETGSSKFVGGVAIPFAMGGRIAAAAAAAAKSREVAEAELDLGRRALRAQVRSAFVEALAWQARLALLDELADLARRSRETAEQRVRAGDAPEAEQIKAEVEFERIALDRTIIDSERQGARRRLASLLGMPDAPLVELDGVLAAEIQDIALAELKDRVLRDHPRIRALTLAWEAARLELRLARRERIPDLTFSLGLGSSPEVRDAGHAPLLEAGVSLPIPVRDRNQGRIAEAQAKAGRAAREAEAAFNALLLELQEEHRRYTIAGERLRRYQAEILPRAQRSLEQAQAGYQAGKLRLLDVLDAQRTLGEARALSLDAQRDLAVARAELDQFIGE